MANKVINGEMNRTQAFAFKSMHFKNTGLSPKRLEEELANFLYTDGKVDAGRMTRGEATGFRQYLTKNNFVPTTAMPVRTEAWLEDALARWSWESSEEQPTPAETKRWKGEWLGSILLRLPLSPTVSPPQPPSRRLQGWQVELEASVQGTAGAEARGAAVAAWSRRHRH